MKKGQSREEMIAAGASAEQAESATALIELLGPCLKRNSEGKHETSWGSKTDYGLYLTLRRFFKEHD